MCRLTEIHRSGFLIKGHDAYSQGERMIRCRIVDLVLLFIKSILHNSNTFSMGSINPFFFSSLQKKKNSRTIKCWTFFFFLPFYSSDSGRRLRVENWFEGVRSRNNVWRKRLLGKSKVNNCTIPVPSGKKRVFFLTGLNASKSDI